MEYNGEIEARYLTYALFMALIIFIMGFSGGYMLGKTQIIQPPIKETK